MRDVPFSVRRFVWVTVAIGGALSVVTLMRAQWGWTQWIILAGGLALSFMRVDLQRYDSQHRVFINMDIAVAFFMLALFGPAWAMLSLGINTLTTGLFARTRAYKIVINIGILIISSWVAAELVYQADLPWLWGLLLGAVWYFLINTGLIALVIGMLSNRRPLDVWRESSTWLIAHHITLAVAGFALGKIVAEVGWWALLAALPLPMLHYTYSLYAKANEQHIKQQETLSSELITTLAAVVDARDAYTFGHSTFVARYSQAIAEQMGYSKEHLSRLYRSALLHDIGKVGISEAILFKPDRLTPEEFAIMKGHTTIGYQIIRQISSLSEAAIVALYHHERWNGSGYPFGLAEEQVDLDSRIVGVADTLETILSDRPYRKGVPLENALAEIDRCTGSLFDPSIVAALHKAVEARGPSFFVNSAKVVQNTHSTPWPWSPEELTNRVASASNQG